MAGQSVTILRGKTDEEIAQYFKSSLAFIFPGQEDFGIVAVEALAAGTPVIAYKAGGALDYIKPTKNGLFFETQTDEALEKVLQKFDPEEFNESTIARSAEAFDPAHFKSALREFIKSSVKSQ
jgi:glycosyltransferase involved in cell wall biosynthesis